MVADPVTLGSHYSQQHGNVTEWRCNIEGCGLLLKTRDTLYYHKKYTHKNKTDQEITHKRQTIEKETNQEQRIKNKIKVFFTKKNPLNVKLYNITCNNEQRWDMYVFIREPKFSSISYKVGARFRLSYKYINVPCLLIM